jgi:hypothetical protein
MWRLHWSNYLTFHLSSCSKCRNPSLGLATKVGACKGAGQEWNLGIAYHVLSSVGKCEGMNTHSQVGFHFGSYSPDGLPNFQRANTKIKTHWIEEFLIPLERFWNLDV